MNLLSYTIWEDNYMLQERERRVVIESDEEIDGGFSCLLEETKTGS